MIARLPFPDDSPVRCDFVDSLVSDNVRSKAGTSRGIADENEAIAVLEQFPIVVLPSRAARRLGAPLPELLPRPRQLTTVRLP